MKKPVWTQRDKDRVIHYISFWLQELGCCPLNRNIDFHDEDTSDDGESASVAQMSCLSLYPYREVNINVYPVVRKLSDRRLSQCACHEILHYLVKPLKENRLTATNTFSQFEENFVDSLALSLEIIAHEKDEIEKELRKTKRFLAKRKKKK